MKSTVDLLVPHFSAIQPKGLGQAICLRRAVVSSTGNIIRGKKHTHTFMILVKGAMIIVVGSTAKWDLAVGWREEAHLQTAWDNGNLWPRSRVGPVDGIRELPAKLT